MWCLETQWTFLSYLVDFSVIFSPIKNWTKCTNCSGTQQYPRDSLTASCLILLQHLLLQNIMMIIYKLNTRSPQTCWIQSWSSDNQEDKPYKARNREILTSHSELERIQQVFSRQFFLSSLHLTLRLNCWLYAYLILDLSDTAFHRIYVNMWIYLYVDKIPNNLDLRIVTHVLPSDSQLLFSILLVKGKNVPRVPKTGTQTGSSAKTEQTSSMKKSSHAAPTQVSTALHWRRPHAGECRVAWRKKAVRGSGRLTAVRLPVEKSQGACVKLASSVTRLVAPHITLASARRHCCPPPTLSAASPLPLLLFRCRPTPASCQLRPQAPPRLAAHEPACGCRPIYSSSRHALP